MIRKFDPSQTIFGQTFGPIARMGLGGVIGKIRSRGLGWFFASIGRHAHMLQALLLNRRFDKKFGIDTAGRIPWTETGDQAVIAELGHEFISTPVKSFNHMMAQIGQDWSEHTLVDFGSGKGRVLILAAELGFKRAIGVELSPELAATAQRNIAAYAARQAPKTTLESANVDARDFALPDGPVVLYFYSPFPEALVAEIVERARQSLRACPRDMVICYAEEPEYPIPDVFACDSFKALSVAPIPYDPGAIRQLHFAAFRALG